MKCSVNVTFEFLMKPPLTLKIASIEATAPGPIANRAIREAKKALKPHSWTSMVVLLQRLDEPENETSENDGPDDENGRNDV